MSRNTSYQFVSEDLTEIIERKVAKFEELTGHTVLPSSPEMLFIRWDAYNELVLRTAINKAGRANVPSSAEGDDLDRLGEMMFVTSRPEATAAVTTLQFTISEAQSSAVLIPAGTRVTTLSGSPVFATDEDVYVAAGDTTAEVDATCQTTGSDGNGYAVGQLNTLVDVFTYFSAVTNITETDGGSDVPTDDEYYELMVAGQDAYSTAGARGAYEYLAKSVSNEIEDVVVNSPSAGVVDIYTLMEDGTIATSTVKALILAKCSAEEYRPLTDYVRTQDPETVSFDITLTYYLNENSSESAATLEANIESAVDDYVAWQQGKLGRDINPDELIQRIKDAGAKRVVITSPTYTSLRNGVVDDPDSAQASDYVPQLAQLGTRTLTNGGYEDE